jgi:hypothetical protein
MKDLRFTVPIFLADILLFCLHFTDMLLLWCGITAWESLTGQKLSAETQGAMYFGLFAVNSFQAWRKQAGEVRVAEAALAAEKKASSPVRVFVDNPEVLLDRDEPTGVRAERLLVPYLNRWIRISGRFEGTADSLVGDAIFASLILKNGRRIQLRFPLREADRLRALRPEQEIVAVCQIRHGYGAGAFTLENCELTEARSMFARAA